MTDCAELAFSPALQSVKQRLDALQLFAVRAEHTSELPQHFA